MTVKVSPPTDYLGDNINASVTLEVIEKNEPPPPRIEIYGFVSWEFITESTSGSTDKELIKTIYTNNN